MTNCVVKPKTDDPEAAHDFARIRPQSRSKTMLVSLVVMAAEHSVSFSRFGQPPSNFRVVREQNFPSTHFQLGQRIVPSHVRMPRRHPAQQKPVAIIVAKYTVNRTRKTLGQIIQYKRRTTIAQKKNPLRTARTHRGHDPLQMIQPVMNVRKHSNLHDDIIEYPSSRTGPSTPRSTH